MTPDASSPLVSHLRAEARKVTTTRALPAHAVAALAVGVLGVAAQPAGDVAGMARPVQEQQFLMIAALSRIALVLLGARLVLDEYRHGTALSTFATARRHRDVVAAKLLVGLLAGGLVGLVAQAGTLLTAVALFDVRGGTLVLDGALPWLLVGAAVAGACWAAIGVAVGELGRSSTPVVVGLLLWVLMLEDLLGARLASLRDHLPGAGAFELFLSADAGHVASGAMTMAAWVAALGAVALLLVGRRDVPG